MGKQSAPAAPDYTSAANATAAGNIDAARAAAAANRVNQVTNNGSLTYTYNPVVDQAKFAAATNAWKAGGSKGNAPVANDYLNPDSGWTATQTLSPAQQAIADQSNTLNLGLVGAANQGLDYAKGVLSKPGIDQSQLPSTGINPGQSYQDAMMARLSPQIQRENTQSDAQLANQGIIQGSEAYNNAKTLLNQSHNDLLNNATTTGMNMGMAANNQAFNQAGYNQMQPINVINALRTGSQVQNPNFVNTPIQQTTQGADLLGAAQGQYNAQVGNVNAANAQTAGMFGTAANLGGMAMMSGMFSDRRLKRFIHPIGKMKNGLTRYHFKYLWSPFWHEGVIAQEALLVVPEAVKRHWSGFLMVNYALLGE